MHKSFSKLAKWYLLMEGKTIYTAEVNGNMFIEWDSYNNAT